MSLNRIEDIPSSPSTGLDRCITVDDDSQPCDANIAFKHEVHVEDSSGGEDVTCLDEPRSITIFDSSDAPPLKKCPVISNTQESHLSFQVVDPPYEVEDDKANASSTPITKEQSNDSSKRTKSPTTMDQVVEIDNTIEHTAATSDSIDSLLVSDSNKSNPAKVSKVMKRSSTSMAIEIDSDTSSGEDATVGGDDCLPNCKIGSISLTRYSANFLKPGECLDDQLINFFLLYIQNYILSPDKQEDWMIMNTFFYTHLSRDAQTDENELESAQRHERVRRWIRNGRRVFDSEMIVVPINENNLHWYVALILRPYRALKHGVIEDELLDPRQTRESLKSFTESPCIILLDSMGGAHRPRRTMKVSDVLIKWLQWEFNMKEEYAEEREQGYIFNTEKIKIPKGPKAEQQLREEMRTSAVGWYVFPDPRLPHQLNSFDCGLYVLSFIATIGATIERVDDLLSRPTYVNKRGSIGPEWPDQFDVALLREKLRNMLDTLQANPGWQNNTSLIYDFNSMFYSRVNDLHKTLITESMLNVLVKEGVDEVAEWLFNDPTYLPDMSDNRKRDKCMERAQFLVKQARIKKRKSLDNKQGAHSDLDLALALQLEAEDEELGSHTNQFVQQHQRVLDKFHYPKSNPKAKAGKQRPAKVVEVPSTRPVQKQLQFQPLAPIQSHHPHYSIQSQFHNNLLQQQQRHFHAMNSMGLPHPSFAPVLAPHYQPNQLYHISSSNSNIALSQMTSQPQSQPQSQSQFFTPTQVYNNNYVSQMQPSLDSTTARIVNLPKPAPIPAPPASAVPSTVFKQLENTNQVTPTVVDNDLLKGLWDI